MRALAMLPIRVQLPRSGAWGRFTLLIGLGLGALWFYLAWARFSAVHHRTFDLALYARMAWGLARGETWVPVVGSHAAALHSAWVLFPLGGLGRPLGTVPVLLAAQVLAVVGASWAFARMGARRFGPPGYLWGATAWLLYPNLGHVLTYEFHPGTLALFPLALALDAVDRRAPWALLSSSLLAILCRADLALLTGLLALLYVRDRSSLAQGARWTVGLSFGYAAVYLVLVPRLAGANEASLDAHFGHLGGSFPAVVRTALVDPLRVVAHITSSQRWLLPWKLLAPLALLPLASPRWLVPALVPLTANVLSSFPTTVHLYSHYHSAAVPFLVAAAIGGAYRAHMRLVSYGRWLMPAAAILALLISQLLVGGMPWSADYIATDFQPDAFTRDAREVLRAIPAGASVQAPAGMLPHLAERHHVDRAPPPDHGHRFVVIDTRHRQRYAQREVLLRTYQEPLARRWLARREYGVLHATPHLLLLERGQDPRSGWVRRYFRAAPEASSRATVQWLSDCVGIEAARLEDARVELWLHARDLCPSDLAVRLGPGPARNRSDLGLVPNHVRPKRVDLLFEGVLSPAQLRPGDKLRSPHPLTPHEAEAIRTHGLWVGALRARGARASLQDPVSVPVPLLE